jgi:hypothetical protein
MPPPAVERGLESDVIAQAQACALPLIAMDDSQACALWLNSLCTDHCLSD